MPELPEAETIVRGLAPRVTGSRIARTQVLHADLLDETPGRFARGMKGRRVTGVSRRGKNVVVELEGPLRLVVNLGMTGGMFALARGERARGITHPGVRFHLEGGGRLVYDDARRFGRLRRMDPSDWAAFDASLGPEPLEVAFTAPVLAAGLARSRSPLRSWLLDQRRVAGVGNIYAVEACHLAGLDPRRPADSLDAAQARALHRALVRVLDDAVRARGTTIRDYRDADGRGGGFGPRLRAYGREGLACNRCGSTIRRVVFGGRSGFLCEGCQS